MTDRIQFITHERKLILLLDLSNCTAAEIESTVRELPEIVSKQPRGSVLILGDFTGASVNEDASLAMQQAAVFDKPYIKKAAWVGAESIPKHAVEQLQQFSRRTFPTFHSRQQALAWLVND